ncbi:AAA+-type ATPase [Coemansia biformis]|uniref:AAA+-type ATPase n=1 Tax=Coemansia biformis TaxID=1286918 RepID=A0A9W7YGB5_9FUNG|nr:AAA+-type ATPase [Coemansia biformis]
MGANGLVAGDVVRFRPAGGAADGPVAFGTAWPLVLGEREEVQLTDAALLNCQAKLGDALLVERVAGPLATAQRVTVSLAARHGSGQLAGGYIKEALVDMGCVCPGQLVDIALGGNRQRIRIVSVRTAPAGTALLAGDCAVVSSDHTQVMVVDGDGDSTDAGIGSQPPAALESSIGGLEDEVAEVRRLVDAALWEPEAFAAYGLQAPRGVLLSGPPGTGKTLIAREVAAASGATVRVINGAEIVSKFYGESEARLRSIFDEARQQSPSIVFIDELDALCPKRGEGDAGARVVATLLTLLDGVGRRGGDRVVVLGATNRPDAIDSALRRPGRFDREIEIPIPTRQGRRSILAKKLAAMPNTLTDAQVDALAAVTHGFVGADLAALLRESAVAAIRRHDRAGALAVGYADAEAAMKVVRPSTMREVALEIPSVRWSDIGGQHATKQLLKESVEWPLQHPEAFQRMGIRPPKGVLLYGPPGCSKTLTAKALATEAGLNFIAVRGPELLSKWVGESEKAVREVFRKARAAAPAIVFFDEIDALAPARGASGDGTSVADRVLSQLLTELDGIEPLVSVTVVAATNRPDVIDPALLRPDRIDRLVYVGPPDTPAREEILRLQLARMATATDVDAAALARRTDGHSGAEVVALCQEAALEAIADDPDAEHVEMRHFDRCLDRFRPRITAEMLQFYASFQSRV